MKIILKKDYELLGDEGQVVDVKEGYARNYLIPNGIASIASDSNLRSFEEIRKQRAKKIQKEIEEAKKLSGDLTGQSINILVKSGEDNKIFGSVTSHMIHDKLVEAGFQSIERKKILLKEPIRSLGEHEVDVKLHSSVIVKLKVNVMKESSQEETESEVSETSSEEKSE